MEDSDAVLLNSCTVKNPSQDTFLFMVEKAKEMGKHVVVSGWVPQGDRNIKGLEDVSVLGVTQIDRVVEVMEETIITSKIFLRKRGFQKKYCFETSKHHSLLPC